MKQVLWRYGVRYMTKLQEYREGWPRIWVGEGVREEVVGNRDVPASEMVKQPSCNAMLHRLRSPAFSDLRRWDSRMRRRPVRSLKLRPESGSTNSLRIFTRKSANFSGLLRWTSSPIIWKKTVVKTSAPIGARKCNFPPFYKSMTDLPTDLQTNRRTWGIIRKLHFR